ncbi:hypothetical protein CEXT_356661 [Caerostris extrusa]|uniref:Uncharacterized protein n=1 Tax=Caerostris extrusa TaxID=172846 RepID=A0AAV4T7Y3_CAEEX|nr:hypothetical protein CEXT_356661 [Caerostris extrusa]
MKNPLKPFLASSATSQLKHITLCAFTLHAMLIQLASWYFKDINSSALQPTINLGNCSKRFWALRKKRKKKRQKPSPLCLCVFLWRQAVY